MKKIIIYYFIFLFSFFAFFSSGVLDSVDGLQYLSVARNIYYQREPTAPKYEYNTRENLHMSSFVAQNGKTYSMTGLGFSISFLPAVFITDQVYKIYNITPQIHFPLDNDWLILMTASFTNSFFGASLGVILFIYFLQLGLNKKESILMSLISLVGTNLFVYTKHTFAHMMFITFMMATFLFIKLFSLKRKLLYLFFAGLSFGILSITYNQTFLLTIPALIVYFLIVCRVNFKKDKTKLFKNILNIVLGFLPFLGVYFWYENLREIPERNLAGVNFYSGYATHLLKFPIGIFFEGIHGQLFSPGRSIFIYSPLLLITIIFWMKIKNSFKAELISFLVLSIIYISFYSSQYTIGAPDQGIVSNWHGELSWGPRYLTPLIPLGMLIVGVIYKVLSKKEKLFIFFPLFILGLLIEVIGIIIPYQVRLHDLEPKIFLNGTEYFSSLYSDFLPRYNPIYNMSKNLVKLTRDFPKSFDHGKFNVRFYDGIDFTFPVGGERWRVIENRGFISFDNYQNDSVHDLTFSFINQPIETSSESAKISINLNGQTLNQNPLSLKVSDRHVLKVDVPKNILKEKGNQLIINSNFEKPIDIKFPLNPNVIIGHKQILGLMAFDINGQRQNLESIDVPYVSSLGPATTRIQYKNWGGENKDLWKFWDIHTQTFERLPDFWWIRNLFYWDIPKAWILILLLINVSTLIFSGLKLKKLLH